MIKPVVVQWDVVAYGEFTKLQHAVSKRKKSRTDPSYEQLLSSIRNTIENLKVDAFHGNLVPRKYLTKKIIDKYGTDKIFRLDLVGYWRLLYTVVGDERQIVVLILEYMDHPTYDGLFGYKKR